MIRKTLMQRYIYCLLGLGLICLLSGCVVIKLSFKLLDTTGKVVETTGKLANTTIQTAGKVAVEVVKSPLGAEAAKKALIK